MACPLLFIITQDGLGGSPSAYTSISTSSSQIINRANNGNSYSQATAGTGSYVIEASNGPLTSRVNIDSSAIQLISGQGGSMASNGMSGNTSGVGSGALQIHQSAQTIAHNATIGNLLEGKSYQNKVNGNLFVDGNVYINGTLEYVSSNAATTTVTSTAGSSILGASLSTSGGTSTVMKDTDATHATVDQNGKIALVPGVSAQSSSALTLTNGLGNTHGFIVNETQATMSGGINSSSLTLNDNGATFSNSATGMPIQVHGVADGTHDFDAVNVRQLKKVNNQLSAGIAGTVATANIPHVDTGKNFSIGAGIGNFQGATALAIGSSYRIRPDTVLRASVSGVDSGSSRTTTVGMGIGISW
ncbi:TPA: YadA-like family protein [Pseudomonas aeruginosa]|nr:YadA-like family protein [Pseudomonas aeruginosa]